MRSQKDQNVEATRRAVLRAARRAFAAHGYAGAAIMDIAQAARVTTGAVYHHFGSKQDLFASVAELVEADIMKRVSAAAAGHEGAWDRLRAGMRAAIDAFSEPDILRIAFLEAPGTLGPAAWREIEMRYAYGAMQGALKRLVDEGILRDVSIDLVAAMLLGALTEAGGAIARAGNKLSARTDAQATIEGFLDSLRRDP